MKLSDLAGQPVTVLKNKEWFSTDATMLVEYVFEGCDCRVFGEIETIPSVGELVTIGGVRFIVIKPIAHFRGNIYPYVAVKRICNEFNA